MSVIPNSIRKTEERVSQSNGKTQMTRLYTLKTSALSDSFATVMAASGVPQDKDVMDYGRSIIVKSRDAKIKDALGSGGAMWEITISGETASIVSSSSSVQSDPCKQPPTVASVPVAYSYVAEKAYRIKDDGSEVLEDAVNGAGDPYDPPMMADRFTTQLTITYNVRSLRLSSLSGYLNTVNDKSVTIGGISFDAGVILLRSVQPQSAIDDRNRWYWSVQVILEIDEEKKHCQEIGNKGYRYKDKNGNTVRAINDDNTYATVPVWLDSAGKKTTTPSYRKYRVPKKTGWPDVLSLPKNLRLS